MEHYPRPALAQDLAEALRGRGLFSDAHNGLFLAAPRRTGKSTFLQQDLKPALEQQGIVVVYVDLWADTRRDPAGLIADAIGRELRARLGLVAKAARATGLDSIELPGGLRFDTSRIGQIDGATLVDALRALLQTTKAPVALIIDEAQHALVSEAGEAAMAALKSARDQLNAPGDVNLMLVMSGSDRDKLLRLVNTNGAPFYGSQIHRLSALGEDFVEFMAHRIEQQRPALSPVDRPALNDAFRLFGHRPQFFINAVGEALNPLADTSQRFELRVAEAARRRQDDDEAQMESEFLSLRPIQRAVLARLLELGSRFRPYDADALRYYGNIVGKKVSPQMAQNALESLRDRHPALVWKSARGEYSADDAMMYRWYEKRSKEGRWPPVESDNPPDQP
ncbi:MAG: AAA family ATPase [Gammaproteobacteria bacterium]